MYFETTGLEEAGRTMAEGEFESLKALHAVSPELVPTPYAWGKLGSKSPSGLDTYFLLAEFREVGEQPPNPVRFTAGIAELHKKSMSPTGKFGFHITTCHAKLPQFTECWEDSWAVLYRKQLEHMIRMDRERNGDWPEFSRICELTWIKSSRGFWNLSNRTAALSSLVFFTEISGMRILRPTWTQANPSFLTLAHSTDITSTKLETGEHPGTG